MAKNNQEQIGTRFQRAAIADKLNLYLWRDRDLTKQQALDIAKAELTKEFQIDIKIIESMSLEEFNCWRTSYG